MSTTQNNNADSATRLDANDTATGNYPPDGDCATASGGYGSSANTFSDAAQRGQVDKGAGLVQQSTNGGDLSSEIKDAKQGSDSTPYDESVESREAAEKLLKDGSADRR